MEKRIELEKRGKKPAEIGDLNLDNCRTTTIVGLTDDFVNLETLSLINVGLTSLKGFPTLPNLKRLELSDNRISGGLSMLHTSPKLTNLNLSGNKILTIDVLEPLKELKHLTFLDLFNNEVTNIDKYRDTVFNLLPNLKFLDGFDMDYKEVDTDVEDEEVNGNDDDSESEGEDEEGVEEDGLDEGALDHVASEGAEEDDYDPLHGVYNDDLEDGSDADYEGEGAYEENADIESGDEVYRKPIYSNSGDEIEADSMIFSTDEESESEVREKKGKVVVEDADAVFFSSDSESEAEEEKGKVKEADSIIYSSDEGSESEAKEEKGKVKEADGEESPARGKKRKHEGEEVN